MLAKSHSWYFWVWIKFPSHMHGQNHWPTKPAMNEYHPFKLFWVSLCFSLFLWSWVKYIDMSPGMLVCIHILEKNISTYSAFSIFILFYKSLKKVAIQGWDEFEQSQNRKRFSDGCWLSLWCQHRATFSVKHFSVSGYFSLHQGYRTWVAKHYRCSIFLENTRVLFQLKFFLARKPCWQPLEFLKGAHRIRILIRVTWF